MTMPTFLRPLLAAALSAALITGCEAPKAPAPAPEAAPTDPAAAPSAPAAPAAAPVDGDAVLRKPAGIPAPEGMPPAYGDWLLSRAPVEMKHLNPLNTTDAYAARAIGYIFDSLLFRDPLTLELQPGLAESWEVSPDHLVYTFKIRDGVKFHDGQPFSVEDVKFTFDTMMNPLTDCADLRNYYQDFTSCEILDPKTVRFTASKPFFLHEVMLGDLQIIPKHIYGTGDFNNHPNNRAPIGSGPYKLDRWTTGQEVVFARNLDYWGKSLGREGHIDKFIWRIITDDNAAMQAALRGDLDSLSMLPKNWVAEAASPQFEQQFNKIAFSSPAFWYMGWNQRKPYFQDKRVRKAMTLLLDRETIRTTILHGLADQLTSPFMPGTAESNPDIEPLPFDPAAAAALLDEAGWKDTNGNGLRDKDGTEFKFEIMFPTTSEEWEQIATVHKEELQRNGIEMNIRQLEWATLIDTIDKRDFDAIIMGWAMSPDPDMYQLWHSSQIEKGSNYVAFNVPEADQIMVDYRASFDKAERARLGHRFHEIIAEEQPYTFLFTPKALVGVSKRVHNVVIYPLFRTRPYLEWFVPAELQKYK